MPVFEVTDPKGRTLELEGDHEPSESELTSIFSQSFPDKAPDKSKMSVGEMMLSQAEFEQQDIKPVDLPIVGQPGTFTRGASKVVSGLVHEATTPQGLAVTAALALPAVGPVLGTVLGASAVKQAAEKAGEYSVTGNQETLGEATASGVLGIVGTALPLAHIAKTSPLTASAVKETLLETKPAPPLTEQAPESPTPTVAAVSEANQAWEKQGEIRRTSDGSYEWVENGEVLDSASEPNELIRAFHSDNAGYSTRVEQLSDGNYRLDLADVSEGKKPVHELIPFDPRAKGKPSEPPAISEPTISDPFEQIRVQTPNGVRRVVVRASIDPDTNKVDFKGIQLVDDKTGAYEVFNAPPLNREIQSLEEAQQLGNALVREKFKQVYPKQVGGGTEVKPAAATIQPTAEVQMADPIISEGPGAASPSDFPKESQLSQLTGTAKDVEPVPKGIVEAAKFETARIWEQVTEKWEGALGNLASLGKQAMASLRGEHAWTDFKDALGKFSGSNNRNDFELQQFTKSVRKAIPDETRREAIVNWIQADGDNAILASRASVSKGPRKKGYETAQQLTPDEMVLAGNVRSYLDAKLQEGIDAGLLKEGIENYVTQIWDRPNPVTNKLIGEAVSGKLSPNFKFARQRIFESYFEGEQAGYKPKLKDVGFLIAAYDRAFSRAIAGRNLIKALHEGKASDGRPLVEISGMSNLLSENGNPSALLIKPKAKPEELAGYLPIDHPALRGWKWAGTDPETGATIMYQGDMVVHPEILTHLKNSLSSSALRQNVFFRGLLETQSLLKQSKLALSGFHFTQEGAHAAAHRVNPLAPTKIDFSIPEQSALVDHGLQVADYRAYQAFSEGLSGAGSIYEKVPVVGKWLTRYNEYLFQEYIPRLKMTMAMDALERNRARFKDKLSDDQILELTANQSNAAFGELNYTMLGRNATFQDFFRLAALAPDFLEARFRFAAQALTKTGTEQRIALALQAATLYVAARILNQALDGDPHWEPKYAFEVIANKRRYGIRTVAEDTMHLVSEPSQFLYNRLAPLSKAAVEFATGRDWRGIKRTTVQQFEDLASWLTPITFQKGGDKTRIDTALSASGVTVRSATGQQRLMDSVNKFKEENNLVTAAEKAGMVSPSEYGPLRNAIKVGTESEIRKEYESLLHPSDGTAPRTEAQIRRHFVDAIRAPVGGSRKIEHAFLNAADQKTKDLWLEARKERQETAVKLMELQQKWHKETK